MPRDISGNYTLPAGNPVVPGSVVTSSWANTTMDDVALAITDSLDRNGRGGMLSAFLFADGTNLSPGMSWTNEPQTGQYRFGAQDIRMVVNTQDNQRWNTAGSQLWDQVDSIWRSIVMAGASGSVPDGQAQGDTLAWDQDTDQEWKLVLANAGGVLPIATNGQVLRWDGTTDMRWEASSAMTISDAENVVIGNLLLVPDGTALAPTYSFSADLDTGMYRIGDNQLGFGTAGVLALEIDATQNLLPAALVDGRDIAIDGAQVDTNTTDIGTVTGDLATHEADLAIHFPGTGFLAQVALDQAAYDLLAPPDANTIYFVTA